MEYFINCNTSPLTPYTTPLDRQKAEHLYRRLGFSASVATIDAAIGQSATALVNTLINEAINMAPQAAPPWADWNADDYPEDDDLRRAVVNAQVEEWRVAYSRGLLTNNLRDRLSFFWSNHLVTELRVYECNSFLYYYTNTLQRNAIGNLKTFISEMGLTSAMLYYLDGVFNNGNNPNENYARELYELFSLGDGNGYTEQDIIETAKALTGYVERGEVGCSPVTFRADRFDPGPKTIFGRTGNWDYDDVMDILFEERPNEIANFICRKLYEFFVHPDSKDDAGNAATIIQGMASTFVSNNFEIAPVLTELFSSQHFFDDDAVGVILKSPYDMYLNLMNETNFGCTDATLLNIIDASALIGQELFNPVDVAGWQRDRTWINTNFMIGRWLTSEIMLERLFQEDMEQFRTFAMDAVGPADNNTSNPRVVVEAIVNKLLPKGLLTDIDFGNALSVFAEAEGLIQEYYSPDYIDGGLSLWMLSISIEVPTQVYLLLLHIVRQPEYQLK
ncbi:DUF1800 domain-containing protein [Spongiimicrobium salis]|uniref:DUF1800 domain-containing protein n=1 Tax=Spongiimicrobium salis TaxID=1667022 RepID=UPI00374CE8BC